MHILHLDSSVLGGQSVTRLLTGALVDALRRAHPQSEISYRDLAAEPITRCRTPFRARVLLAWPTR